MVENFCNMYYCIWLTNRHTLNTPKSGGFFFVGLGSDFWLLHKKFNGSNYIAWQPYCDDILVSKKKFFFFFFLSKLNILDIGL